jgi:hypothetical protein
MRNCGNSVTDMWGVPRARLMLIPAPEATAVVKTLVGFSLWVPWGTLVWVLDVLAWLLLIAMAICHHCGFCARGCCGDCRAAAGFEAC